MFRFASSKWKGFDAALDGARTAGLIIFISLLVLGGFEAACFCFPQQFLYLILIGSQPLHKQGLCQITRTSSFFLASEYRRLFV